jgi:hypothetical protein
MHPYAFFNFKIIGVVWINYFIWLLTLNLFEFSLRLPLIYFRSIDCNNQVCHFQKYFHQLFSCFDSKLESLLNVIVSLHSNFKGKIFQNNCTVIMAMLVIFKRLILCILDINVWPRLSFFLILIFRPSR